MNINSCEECPFFENPFSGVPLLGILAMTAVIEFGVCGYNAAQDNLVQIRLGMKAGPEKDAMMATARGRLVVYDARVVPEGCPLRTRDITLTLAKV